MLITSPRLSQCAFILIKSLSFRKIPFCVVKDDMKKGKKMGYKEISCLPLHSLECFFPHGAIFIQSKVSWLILC